jgi:sugar (pentulose or hexulose) kinase
VRLFGGDHAEISLPQLDAEAEHLPVGAEGVGMLETLQGSRTPVTDPRARGALLGLTLAAANPNPNPSPSPSPNPNPNSRRAARPLILTRTRTRTRTLEP